MARELRCILYRRFDGSTHKFSPSKRTKNIGNDSFPLDQDETLPL